MENLAQGPCSHTALQPVAAAWKLHSFFAWVSPAWSHCVETALSIALKVSLERLHRAFVTLAGVPLRVNISATYLDAFTLTGEMGG